MRRHPMTKSGTIVATTLLLVCGTGAMRGAAAAVATRSAATSIAAGRSPVIPRPACLPITAAVVAEGRTIFGGAGHCFACHGAEAVGTVMAPTLHAHTWLNITGSYASIVGLVTSGVSKPKAHAEQMPPKGGADLSTNQVCAVAAYAFSLSHSTAAVPAAASAAAAPGAVRSTRAAAGRPAPRAAATGPAAAPTSTAAAPAAADGSSRPETVSMSSGSLTISFTGTRDSYTIHVTDAKGGTSSSYGFSARGAPPLAQESTATPVAVSASVPVVAVAGAANAAAATPAATGTTSAQAPGCPPVAPALVAEGRKVFTGPGNCYACHGDNATGTPMAPTLHAHVWLDADGSYASIMELVTSGVATPKAHPAPMPPKGGGQLSGGQVCAVAAYVYSLSH